MNRQGLLIVVPVAIMLITHSTRVELGAQISGTARVGPLPIHIYTLRLPPGSCPHPNPAFTECRADGDTLPPGGGIFYTFGIFDTASTMVRISIGPENLGDDRLLQICSPTQGCRQGDRFLPPSLDIRIWGLGAVDPRSLGAPLDTPEAEVTGIKVRTAGFPTLIGAPVANRVVAFIDYRAPVSRTYSFGTVKSVDVEFFAPGAVPPDKSPLFEVELERFGTIGSSQIDGATLGQRYYVRDVVFRNGSVSADGQEFDFIYDTSTTTTMVSTEVALALGIDPFVRRDDTLCLRGNPQDNCAGGELLDGFLMDRFEMSARNGSHEYVISDPLVFVRPPSSPEVPPRNAFGGAADGIIGANYFSRTRVLVNGPANTLGLFEGVPIRSLRRPGDCNRDGRLDISDGICLLGHLFLGSPERLPCGDGTLNELANVRLLDSNGSGTVDLSDAVSVFTFLFLGGLPPVLGRECAPIPGCPNLCQP